MSRGEGPAEVGPRAPQTRLVLLGASNIARNFTTVVRLSQHVFAGPLDLLIAAGHGRGYGLDSWVLGRWLPPILSCGIWDALAARPRLETVVLLTDIGNDIVYGAQHHQVLGWVEQCLVRLERLNPKFIVSALPLDTLMQLGSSRFLLMRTLLFPRSRLTHTAALEEVQRLNEGVVALAQQYQAQLVLPSADWYGFDPIHVKARHRVHAWHTLLTAGLTPAPPPHLAPFWRNPWSLRLLRPHSRKLLGLKQTRSQPCAELSDGSLISLY